MSRSLFLSMGKLKTRFKNLYETFWLCFYKKQKRANALFKRAKRAIHSFKKRERAIHSFKKRERAIHFFVKKRVIQTKNQRANSQPRHIWMCIFAKLTDVCDIKAGVPRTHHMFENYTIGYITI